LSIFEILSAIRVTPWNKGFPSGLIAERKSLMLSKKHSPERNKLDLADPRQVRVLKKRLGVSDDDLKGIVEKVGESIAAVSKEAELQKEAPPPEPISTTST
jgi:hypothetical protein